MPDFIAGHPNLVYAAFLAVVAVALYFYRRNENAAAMLIANKLDTIAEKLDVLFIKDAERNARIETLSERQSELRSALAKQIQRCDDRAESCPGKQALKTLDRNGLGGK